MTLTSRSALIEALASGKPEDLLGTAESSWLDFKGAPYALNTDRLKFELCKDVAAFANALGGLLVCGVAAEKQSDRAVEVATRLQPFPQDRADVDRYIDTLNEYLRPRVIISHFWYRDPTRSTTEAALYYLVIEVEPVPEPDRYVIVRRMLNDRGMFADGLAIPLRHGDRTVYLPSEDAYRLINDGLRGRDAPVSFVGPPPGGLEEEAEQSLDTLERLQDWDDTPVLLWQSIPPHPAQILPDLHSNDGIRGALRNQDVLRPTGFNFQDSTGRLRTHEGGLFLGRTRCALWVRPDGLTTAGAIATPDMLCWAMDQRGYAQRINAYVLTEMTLEYFRIADEVVAPRAPGPWGHRIVARRFQGDQPRALGPGSTGPTSFLSDASLASADTWVQAWTAIGDPERDAFEALRRIYALFGVDVTSNPDVQDDRLPILRFRDG
ncbi:helix-turn-helix domain-containing protein [Actinomadura sp. 3N508]|uniref:helix-turn-helix domain-containing protein n=1 Tax=Actinomadura sp. 3N508 TaxID=3375153 RepID=UPI0037B86B08